MTRVTARQDLAPLGCLGWIGLIMFVFVVPAIVLELLGFPILTYQNLLAKVNPHLMRPFVEGNERHRHGIRGSLARTIVILAELRDGFAKHPHPLATSVFALPPIHYQITQDWIDHNRGGTQPQVPPAHDARSGRLPPRMAVPNGVWDGANDPGPLSVGGPPDRRVMNWHEQPYHHLFTARFGDENAVDFSSPLIDPYFLPLLPIPSERDLERYFPYLEAGVAALAGEDPDRSNNWSFPILTVNPQLRLFAWTTADKVNEVGKIAVARRNGLLLYVVVVGFFLLRLARHWIQHAWEAPGLWALFLRLIGFVTGAGVGLTALFTGPATCYMPWDSDSAWISEEAQKELADRSLAFLGRLQADGKIDPQERARLEAVIKNLPKPREW